MLIMFTFRNDGRIVCFHHGKQPDSGCLKQWRIRADSSTSFSYRQPLN